MIPFNRFLSFGTCQPLCAGVSDLRGDCVSPKPFDCGASLLILWPCVWTPYSRIVSLSWSMCIVVTWGLVKRRCLGSIPSFCSSDVFSSDADDLGTTL